MNTNSLPFTLRTQPFHFLGRILSSIRSAYRSLPVILPVTPENLRLPLRPNQRRLVVGDKIIILTT